MQHYNAEGYDVGMIRRCKQSRIAGIVAISERLHDSIDLLRFPRQVKPQEQFADGNVYGIVDEVEVLHIHSQSCIVKGIGSKMCGVSIISKSS